MTSRPTCIVTNGLYEGLALAAAIRLASTGWNIAIIHRPETRRPEAVVDALTPRIVHAVQSFGAECRVCRADVSDGDVAGELVEELGRGGTALRAVINGEGARAYPPRSLLDLDDAQWRDDLDREVFGPLALLRAAFAVMRRDGGGRVVNLTNHRPSWDEVLPLRDDHSAGQNSWSFLFSKQARSAMAPTVSRALYREAVTINNIEPGRVRPLSVEEVSAHVRDGTRPAEVTSLDVADVVAFLCSPAGRAVTGATLPVLAAPLDYEVVVD